MMLNKKILVLREYILIAKDLWEVKNHLIY